MKAKYIVDTNVPVVANRAAPQASPQCVASCARKLIEIVRGQVLALDDGWRIIGEYQRRLRSSGQPGVGDAFLKWVLTNWANPQRCEPIHITLRDAGQDQNDFVEFPADSALDGFDRSDRKFVAVAVAHPDHPPILNAVDSDWWDYRQALERHGVQVEFACPDAPFMRGDSQSARRS